MYSQEIVDDVNEPISRLNWLVELPIAGGLYLATRHAVDHDGKQFTAADVDILRTETDQVIGVRIKNIDGQYTDEVLTGDWRGHPASIYVESAGVVDEHFRGEAVAAPLVSWWIEFELTVPGLRTTETPPDTIGPETGFSNLFAPGRVLEWDDERVVLNPRER